MTPAIACDVCGGEIGPHWQLLDHVHPEAVDIVSPLGDNTDPALVPSGHHTSTTSAERLGTAWPMHPKVRRGQRTVYKLVEQLRAVTRQQQRHHGRQGRRRR